MKVTRPIIRIDRERCDGCGRCVAGCAEGALAIVDGKAALISEVYCDGLGACLPECPRGAITIVERAAAAFDEEAVAQYLAAGRAPGPAIAGCPSTTLGMFSGTPSPNRAAGPFEAQGTSELRHWPVQIRLIPPEAPFLKDAHLLIAADCCAVAAAGFHADFLKGRVVMLGCPKFDDAAAYRAKFTQIFGRVPLKSVTVLRMTVPCCAALARLVEEALAASGAAVPGQVVVIGPEGGVQGQHALGNGSPEKEAAAGP